MLICIDDVEQVIEAELAAQSASATPPPTRLVGVPPSRGRGGNQTPRSESVFITGSQPLPSPSSSYGSSTHLDRWAFGMSKIDGGDGVSKPSSFTNNSGAKESGGSSGASTKRTGGSTSKDSMDQAAERISNVKLETSPFGEKVQPGKSKAAGPSLLSQQAPPHEREEPSHASSSSRLPPSPSNPPPYEEEDEPPTIPGPVPPVSSSAMSVDPNLPLLDGSEKITVKIADLGNGAWFLRVTAPKRLSESLTRSDASLLEHSDVGRASFHRRYPDTTVPVSRGHSWCAMGAQRGYLERGMHREWCYQSHHLAS